MTDASFELLASFGELIAKRSEPFEFSKTFEDAVNDPCLILHSSGSTGKLVVAVVDADALLNIKRHPEAYHNDPRHFGNNRCITKSTRDSRKKAT